MVELDGTFDSLQGDGAFAVMNGGSGVENAEKFLETRREHKDAVDEACRLIEALH